MGKLVPPRSFTVLLGISTYDSMRVWVDGDLVIDGWSAARRGGATVEFAFAEGKEYDLRVEYLKDGGGARVPSGGTSPLMKLQMRWWPRASLRWLWSAWATPMKRAEKGWIAWI